MIRISEDFDLDFDFDFDLIFDFDLDLIWISFWLDLVGFGLIRVLRAPVAL